LFYLHPQKNVVCLWYFRVCNSGICSRKYFSYRKC